MKEKCVEITGKKEQLIALTKNKENRVKVIQKRGKISAIVVTQVATPFALDANLRR